MRGGRTPVRFERRVVLLGGAFLLLAGLLLARLFTLQFVIDEDIREIARADGASVRHLPAIRGAILDREGRILAKDRPAYQVDLVPAQFRERSLLEALLDLEVLLDLVDEDELPRTIRARHWRDRPLEQASELLSVPASRLRVESAVLARRGAVLLRSGGGTLVRRPAELPRRLRQITARLLNDGFAVRSKELQARAGHQGTLGEALNLSVSDLARRLADELEALEEVGREIGFEDLDAMLLAIDARLEEEWRWIEERLESEVDAALCLEEFGTEIPDPALLGREAWSRMTRTLAPTFSTDDPVSRKRAEHALRVSRHLAAGILPPALETPPEVDSAMGLVFPDLERTTVEEQAIDLLRARGIGDAKPRPVRAEWLRVQRSAPDFEERLDSILSERRKRDLVAGFRGGREFHLGSGANATLARRVWGAGGLEEIGFQLRSTYVRDERTQEGASVSWKLMMGEVGLSNRVGRYGLESRLNPWLKGEGGQVVINRKGEVVSREEPQHGRDLQLTLSFDLCEQFAQILAEAQHATPAALVVIDVADGGIVGMASWPTGESLESVRRGREAIALEQLIIRRLIRNPLGSGAIAQRLARLSLENPSEPSLETQVEQRVLKTFHALGSDWLRPRLRELQIESVAHPGWHRAIENPGYAGPGSVFKALTILAGLENAPMFGVDTRIDCVNTRNRDWHKCKNHGVGVSVERALKVSCNEYCYRVADAVGSDGFVDLYKRTGFLDALPGLLPAPGQWMEERLRNAGARNLSIGGQDVSCLPVRAAGIAASLAVGRAVRPTLITEESARSVPRFKDFRVFGESLGSERNLAAIREGMRQVCLPGGTADDYPMLRTMRVAAKTGTSDYQVRRTDGVTVDMHEAWFVGFAPHEAPRYAFAGLISRTTDYGAQAAPMVVEALEAVAKHTGERWW